MMSPQPGGSLFDRLRPRFNVVLSSLVCFGVCASLLLVAMVLGVLPRSSEQHADGIHVDAAPSAWPLRRGEVGALWIAIGEEPSRREIIKAARRYDVVVLNAWDIAQLRLLKRKNPRVLVLVYKDLSSTRSYAVKQGEDDHYLPTGGSTTRMVRPGH
jgi:hypothetical protein